MLTLFCTSLGYVIVASAIGAAIVFVIAALVVGTCEIFSEIRKEAHLQNK